MIAFLVRRGGTLGPGWYALWFTHGLAATAVGEQYEYSLTVPVGDVIRSVPTGGTTQSGTPEVILVISLGPEFFTVPYLVGLLEAEAQTLLTQSGLTVGVRTPASSETRDAGRILNQSVPPGSLVSPGAPVDYGLSTGSAFTVMPWTPGLDAEEAVDAMEQEGIT